jgi:hypothetical protein
MDIVKPDNELFELVKDPEFSATAGATGGK